MECDNKLVLLYVLSIQVTSELRDFVSQLWLLNCASIVQAGKRSF